MVKPHNELTNMEKLKYWIQAIESGMSRIAETDGTGPTYQTIKEIKHALEIIQKELERKRNAY